MIDVPVNVICVMNTVIMLARALAVTKRNEGCYVDHTWCNTYVMHDLIRGSFFALLQYVSQKYQEICIGVSNPQSAISTRDLLPRLTGRRFVSSSPTSQANHGRFD